MSITLIVEDGSASNPDANTYADVAFADAYHLLHGNALWATLTTDQKNADLIAAMDFLEVNYNQRWIERRTILTQPLAWPRVWVIDGDGFALKANVVPIKVLKAQCELALRAAAGTLLVPDLTNPGTIKSEQVGIGGAITKTTTYSSPKSQLASFRMVEFLLREFVNIGGSKLVRS